MLTRLPLLAALASLVSATTATTTSSATAAPSCDCYETSTNEYFLNHQFHDFRSISNVAATPPLPSGLPASNNLIPAQSDYVNNSDFGLQQNGWIQTDAWNDDWATMNWGTLPSSDFPIRMQNSLANVYVSNDDLDVNATSKIVFRTHKFATFQSSAEVESQQKNVFYASFRIRARVHGASGAVAGLFIFQNNNNESDIEILTRDKPQEIRYSNQPVVDDEGNEIPGASTSVNMETGAELDGEYDPDSKRKRTTSDIRWDQWHTHRIDWVEGRSSWFVDGKHYLDKKYGAPTVPSYLVLNMWSNGGVWSGNMTVGDSAYLDISWVEMVFNTSGPITGYPDSSTKVKRHSSKKCKSVCIVDGVDVVGTPQERVGAAGRMVVQYGVLVGAVLVALALV